MGLSESLSSHRRCLAVLLIGLAAFATGCSHLRSQDSQRTTVVLLPDADGHVGAVAVASGAGTQTLSAAGQRTVVAGAGTAPTPPDVMGEAEIQSRYRLLLQAQPPAPKTFVMYFKLDRAELTDESRAALPAMLEEMRQLKATSIVVLGHADASGPSARNLRLSQERAEATARLLRANRLSPDDMDVQFFGDTRPLPASGPEDTPAMNRRVEVLVL